MPLGVRRGRGSSARKEDAGAGDGVALAIADVAGDGAKGLEPDGRDHGALAAQGHPIRNERRESVLADDDAVGRAREQQGRGLEGALRTGLQRPGIEPDRLDGEKPAPARLARSILGLRESPSQTLTDAPAIGWPDSLRMTPTSRPGRPTLSVPFTCAAVRENLCGAIPGPETATLVSGGLRGRSGIAATPSAFVVRVKRSTQGSGTTRGVGSVACLSVRGATRMPAIGWPSRSTTLTVRPAASLNVSRNGGRGVLFVMAIADTATARPGRYAQTIAPNSFSPGRSRATSMRIRPA